MSAPHVSILTVTTNAAAHLPAYFYALERITYPNWSLTVVDNGSSDGSQAIVHERKPAATLIENETNLGFTGACNRALEALRDDPAIDLVLFLNDDTEVTPGFLEPLAEKMTLGTTASSPDAPLSRSVGRGAGGEGVLAAPKTYLAGHPGILDDAAGDFDWWRGAWKRRVLGRQETPEDDRPREINNANLSCLLVPRAAFHDVGLLDDAFFVYYDDTDFCRRALDAGYRIVYEPRSVVFHRKGATLGGQLSAFGCYYLARNRPYLMRKHLSLPRFAVFWVYFLATRATRCALWTARGRWDLVRATAAGVRDFLLGRMGARLNPKSEIRDPK